MNWRKFSIVIGLLILFAGALAFSMMTKEKDIPKVEEVSTIAPQEIEVERLVKGSYAPEIELEGKLNAYNKIDLFAEVGGRLLSTARPFKVGSKFPKGSVLMNIDREEAKLNVLAQKSTLINAITQIIPDLKIDYPESFDQWSSYLNNFNIEEPLLPLPTPINEREAFFINSKNLRTQYYNIKSLENRLSKYTVYAPFSGVITEALITPGSLVRASQKMGALMELGNYELEATISTDELKYLKVGQKVKLTSQSLDGSWTGTIRRISDMIDPNSQSIIAYIAVRSNELKEGLYLTGKVSGTPIPEVTKVKADLVIERSYIFTIDNGQFKKQNVDVIYADAEHMLVKGLPNEVVLPVKRIIGAVDGRKVNIKSTFND